MDPQREGYLADNGLLYYKSIADDVEESGSKLRESALLHLTGLAFLPPAPWILIRRWIILATLLVWGGGMLLVFLGKIVMDSAFSVFVHLTNISWLLQALTGAFLFVGNAIVLGALYAYPNGGWWYRFGMNWIHGVILGLVWPVYGLALIVMTLVQTVIIFDPGLLLHLMEQFGGPYHAGVVIVGNFSVHSLPPVLFLVYVFIFFYRDIVTSMVFLRLWVPRPTQILVFFWNTLGGVVLIAALYASIVPFRTIYHTSVPLYMGLVVVFITLAVLVWPVYLIFWFYASEPIAAIHGVREGKKHKERK